MRSSQKLQGWSLGQRHGLNIEQIPVLQTRLVIATILLLKRSEGKVRTAAAGLTSSSLILLL